jgi:hypothetical protein
LEQKKKKKETCSSVHDSKQTIRLWHWIDRWSGRKKEKKPCTRTVTIITTATTPRGKIYCSACPPVLLLGQQIENDPEERREMWWEILLSNTLPLWHSPYKVHRRLAHNELKFERKNRRNERVAMAVPKKKRRTASIYLLTERSMCCLHVRGRTWGIANHSAHQ